MIALVPGIRIIVRISGHHGLIIVPVDWPRFARAPRVILLLIAPVPGSPLWCRPGHIAHALGRRAQVVQGHDDHPGGDLGHHDQDQEDANAVDPVGIVHLAQGVLREGGGEGVEREPDHQGQEDRDQRPQDLHQHPGVGAQHEINICCKVLDAVDPHDEHDLEDGDPQDRHAAAVVIHYLEHVEAGGGDAGQGQEEAADAQQEDQQGLVLLRLGEGIVDDGEDGLQQGELRVQTQKEQHEEEHHGPHLKQKQ